MARRTSRRRPDVGVRADTRWVCALLVGCVLVGLGATGAAAEPPAPAGTAPTTGAAPAAPPEVTTPTTRPVDRRLLDAGREASAAESARLALVAALADDDDAIGAIDGRIAEVDADLVPARAARDEVAGRLQGRAGQVYRERSAGLGAALSLAGPAQLASGAHYADALAVVDGAAWTRLQSVVDDLEARRRALVADRQARVDVRARHAADLVDAQGRAVAAAAHAATVGATPVMGTTGTSAEGLAAWYRSSGHLAVLSGGTTIEDLAALYVAEAADEGVRADLAFAQAVVETGWFAHAGDNNYAGIGACDSCNGNEIAFASPQAGVRAQVQLLRNYADADSRASQLRHAPEPALHGVDPAAAVRTFDRFSAKGSAPVWDAMGGGRWATDPDYAGKVLDLAARIRAFTTRAG